MSQPEQANKAVVRRLVAEVLNDGRVEAIDELYTPELAPAARRWITPFRASFPDVHMEIVELIAEGDKVGRGGRHLSASRRPDRRCLVAGGHRVPPPAAAVRGPSFPMPDRPTDPN
jgi:hypothetical protein